jgi:cardiolipin synthase A/B
VRPRNSFNLLYDSFLLLVLSILTFGGCASLPDVSEKIQEAPVSRETPRILSAKGLLSPKQSKTLVERLQRSVDPTDILPRYLAVKESVSDSPLTKGNKVTLLVDGPATYDAMFKAIRAAKDQINLETFIFEDIIIDDETGLKLPDLLLQKQAANVQVNILYDSLNSNSTPVSVFQLLRDGGIQVAEFNPINPIKARGKWHLAKSDHRKILIVDGQVAFTGGINISQVYSSGLSGRREHDQTQIPCRDTDVQIQGPAVAEFQKFFLTRGGDRWGRNSLNGITSPI